MSMKVGWVYVLRERDFLTGQTDRYVKIGLTKNEVELRNKDHQTGNPRHIFTVFEMHAPLMSMMEKHLHHVYSADRIHGEWFDLDDARVNNELIPLIERLALEQADTKPLMEAVAQLKKQHDTGVERAPTAAETALHAAYIDAKHALDLAKARHTIIDATIRAMIGSSSGIEGVVEVKPKPRGKAFNATAFKALLSDAELAQCHESGTEFKASTPKFTGTKTLKKLDAQLSDDRKAAKDAITSPASTANLGQAVAPRDATAEQVHAAYLASRRTVREAEWAEVRARNALLAALGQDRALTGLVEWVREDVAFTNRWSKDLAKQHFPKRFEQCMEAQPDTVDVKIAEGHAY